VFAPSTTMSIETRPFDFTATDGSSGRHIAPSAEMTRSAASSAAWALRKTGRCGLPISSSPSNRNFTFSGSRPSWARNACAVLTTRYTGPLSSLAPRPRATSPSTVSSNGGVTHSASEPVGWTS
jgi:hypothetical protein